MEELNSYLEQLNLMNMLACYQAEEACVWNQVHLMKNTCIDYPNKKY